MLSLLLFNISDMFVGLLGIILLLALMFATSESAASVLLLVDEEVYKNNKMNINI